MASAGQKVLRRSLGKGPGCPLKLGTSSEFKAGDGSPSRGAALGSGPHRARRSGALQSALPLALSPGVPATSTSTLPPPHPSIAFLFPNNPAHLVFRWGGGGTSKRASREQLSRRFLPLTSGPKADAATPQLQIILPATPTPPRDSNPSQLPQRPVSLAAVFVTPSRRTLPRRAAAARRRRAPKVSAARLSGSRPDSRLLGNARGCFRRRRPRWAGLGRSCRWESATWESQAACRRAGGSQGSGWERAGRRPGWVCARC